MTAATQSKKAKAGRFQQFGIVFAVLFYLAAVVHVHFFGENKGKLDPDVVELTLAHWQLEDGFREGFEEMIDLFEKRKAEEGVKVKVIQSTVPVRGYKQWMMTQLVGGNPADLIELSGPSSLMYQFFVPLSSYVGDPNPYNKGTPLEGMSWKDTFVDGMAGALDTTYAEYFGVGTFFHTYRLHVNVDLVEKATGSRKMPRDLPEWIDICRQIKEYSARIQKPISPIGVRGFDKGTLRSLFRNYFSQMNGNLNDHFSRFCDGEAQIADILKGLESGEIDPGRLTAVVDALQELGQYFVEGFTAVDLEQSKYLFYCGRVAFFPEGSWNSYSLVRNTPFEVKVIPVPPIGTKYKYGKYFTGPVTESGVRVGGRFGIPKACENFDLALELLQFMTSWKINQMTMDACKWPPAVKKAEFKGILKAFVPREEGNLPVKIPFGTGWRTTSQRKMMEVMEEIIMAKDRIDKPRRYFLDEFFSSAWQKSMEDEIEETIVTYQRANLEREMQRSQIAVGLLGDEELSGEEQDRLLLRRTLARESFAEGVKRQYVTGQELEAVRQLKKEDLSNFVGDAQ